MIGHVLDALTDGAWDKDWGYISVCLLKGGYLVFTRRRWRSRHSWRLYRSDCGDFGFVIVLGVFAILGALRYLSLLGWSEQGDLS